MSISFSKIKDPKLGLTDKITFGKLKDCRICDVIEDHHEYLMWCEKEGYMRFQTMVVETIKETLLTKGWEQHIEEEVKPFLEQKNHWFTACDEDDIPF